MTIADHLLPEPSPAPPLRQARITINQYNQMIEQHILPEDPSTELLNGLLVHKNRAALGEDPTTIGSDHRLVVKLLAGIDARLVPLGCHMQTQQPITLSAFDEPEPDAALLLGKPRDYTGRKPTAKDVLAVIEVADSSLATDRTTKLEIYARANLPLYLIINLPEKCIEQYTHPLPKSARYAQMQTLTPKQSLALPLPKKKCLKLPVASLLP
jgi:hypothetical protein